uniref:CASP-like protein n=1 Tax=Aegilops tauschii subsp. strangulata TaxID=200361 RepID=A0A453M2D4_AEGTS
LLAIWSKRENQKLAYHLELNQFFASRSRSIMPCDGDDKESKGRLNAVNIAARVAAMGLAVASAALMVTASQCTVVLPNGAEAHTVTYSDFGPFV